ncbi:hypothetical protein ABZV80_08005 [Streptomyces sp. NPDC005132]|uniref:hypothetical protein n=1 Tax=Streptomyces sp. NPDC005132 TaxID=3154294 RepID=UPI0033A3560E
MLGRVSGTWSARSTADLASTAVGQVAADHLTAYTYDTLADGQLHTAVRYLGGSRSMGTAYAKKVAAYDSLYRATGSQLQLPASDALVTSVALPSDKLDFLSFYDIDGTRDYTKEPAVGGLAAEQIETDYNTVLDELGAWWPGPSAERSA